MATRQTQDTQAPVRGKTLHHRIVIVGGGTAGITVAATARERNLRLADVARQIIDQRTLLEQPRNE